MNDIIISESLIKAFLHKGNYRDVCYKRIKATRIDKTVVSPPTESQLKGLYFEGKVLGSSSEGKIWELPRKKSSGEKTISNERIDTQTLKFRQGIVQNCMSVASGVNTQVKIYKRFNDYILLSGEIDIFLSPLLYENNILPATIIDLKLTGDIESDWGEYCWGKPEDLDHIQLIMYNYLVRDIDIPLNQKLAPKIFEMGLIREEILPILQDIPVFYWIFEHKETLRNKFVKVKTDNIRTNELKESIRKTASIIIDETDKGAEGWQSTPEHGECSRCPLNFQNGGLCEDAKIVKEV